MNLTILTPDEEKFNGEVISVALPGIDGKFQILKGHAPLVAALDKGEVKVEFASGETKFFGIAGGFVEVLNESVSVLAKGTL